jgi:uncharacterized protein YhbP (UPF0306 family)
MPEQLLLHKGRIKKELRYSGVTRYGLLKTESRYLPKIIHEDEPIKAAVYGLAGQSSAMLVATDRRVIFLDRKPFFTTMDEVSYEIVAGVQYSFAGRYATLTLFTRVKNYCLRYSNKYCAEKFADFIETKRLDTTMLLANDSGHKYNSPTVQVAPAANLDQAALKFMHANEAAVLSTVDNRGWVHGATVYYSMDQSNNLFILTKISTQKAKNILTHNQVAFTISNVNEMKTAQMSGVASIETDPHKQMDVYRQIMKLRAHDGKVSLPPLSKLQQEAYAVIKVVPTAVRYSDFSSA